MARFCPLFSGSTGNSYYIGSKSAGILVDAGRTAKQIDLMLKACEIDPLAIQGIFITHEHSDHVGALRVFAKRYSLPVFASKGTIRALQGNIGDTVTYVIKDEIQIADMTVKAFRTSHDCAEPLGFSIQTADHRRITISTDMGCISEEVEENLLGADFVVIESNHDIEMLRHGPYPYYLQKRILSNRGHLSNDTCAELLPRLAKSGTTRFMLAHLSQDNNSRQLALETSLASLIREGFIQGEDFLLDAARPSNEEARVILF